MGTLYIVSTPIGNLQDITLRALRILHEVNVIACEDTRRTGILLRELDKINPKSGNGHISPKGAKRLLSYYDAIELRRIPEIIGILLNDLDVALISDAGTPAISDPGFKLIRESIKHGIRVETIPGPSAVLSALVISGLPTDKFLFLGYPPQKPGHRVKLFEQVKLSCDLVKSTVIFFEAPHKLMRTLQDLRSVFGDIELVLCRELTKIHEEIRREIISSALEHFQNTTPKGEFVILFH